MSAESDFALGDAVVYRSHPDAPAEDGVVSRVTDAGVFVRYRGDSSAKLTRPEDLTKLTIGGAR